MEYIYYCKQCKSTFSADLKNSNQSCPNCKIKMLATEMPAEEWRTKSDEEKAELKLGFDKMELKASTESSENANSIGKVLYNVGWIYIALTFIGAFILADEIGGAFALIVAVFGCLGGLLLLGFAEVVNLLQDIKNK